MGEINERESELNAARDKLIEQDEEMRQISVAKEKLNIERDFLFTELKNIQARFGELQTKYNDQARLLVSVVSHTKNPAANNSMNSMNQDGGHNQMEEVARDESMRADRIAR